MNYFVCHQVKDSFHREILLSMFFEWLNHSKNRMNHLKYHNESSFVYQEGRKTLKIEDFHELNIFAIQFTTSDNDKNAQFVVELLYNELNHTLSMSFSKELVEDSRYIEAISIPKIFVSLLHSDYICSDGELKIIDEPRFFTRRELNQLNLSEFRLPVIVLGRNKKCAVNPFRLAQRMFGLAHIFCVYTNKEPDMTIYTPDNKILQVEISSESKMIRTCFEQVLQESFTHISKLDTFDGMMNTRLHHQVSSSHEISSYYKESLEAVQNEIEELKLLLQLSQDHQKELERQKSELENMTKTMHKESILAASEKSAAKKELLIHLMKIKIRDLDGNEIYRRRDVLESILQENDHD